MKVKGITIWEQHLEKIIIGAALLVFAGFTALQFIGNPNAVEIAGQTFTPGDVDQALQNEAESLEGPLEADTAPDFAPVDPQFEAIQTALNDSVVPRETLPTMLASAMPALEGTVTAGTLVNVPTVPTPLDLRRKRYFDSVVDEFVSANETVAALFEGPPYDIQFTTVASTFEIGKMRELLAARGPNDEAPVPVHWHNNQVHIIDVRLERQELMDGEWSEPVVIDPIPTQFSYRETIANEEIDRIYADDIVAQLTENPNVQFAVIQPSFFPLENSRWSPPLSATEQTDEAAEQEDPILRQIGSKQRQLDEKRRRAAAVKRRLDELGGPLEDVNDPENNRPGGAGGGGEFGSGGGGNTLTAPGDSSREQNIPERRRLTATWKRYLRDIERLEEELEALGVHIVPVEEEEQFDPVAELQKDTIDVWAHDHTVEADTTYRYRLRVDVYNPLFGRKLSLKEEQYPIAEEFTLNSEWTEWSNPIEIQRPLEVFVTQANTNSGIASASSTARIEVYRFYDGRWWKEDFNVGPGERIGEVKQVRLADAKPGDPPLEIDFTTSWFVLDVVPGIGVNTSLTASRSPGAAVYLQSLNSPDDLIVRLPADDRINPDREELESEAHAAAELLTASR